MQRKVSLQMGRGKRHRFTVATEEPCLELDDIVKRIDAWNCHRPGRLGGDNKRFLGPKEIQLEGGPAHQEHVQLAMDEDCSPLKESAAQLWGYGQN